MHSALQARNFVSFPGYGGSGEGLNMSDRPIEAPYGSGAVEG